MGTLALAFLVCCSRAAFMVIDPHYMRKVLPPMMLGIIFGVCWPTITALFFLEMSLLYSLVTSIQPRDVAKDKRPGMHVLRTCFYVVTLGQYAVQLAADIMRGLSLNFFWLVICQVYFMVVGVCSTLFLGTYSARLYRLTAVESLPDTTCRTQLMWRVRSLLIKQICYSMFL